MDTVSVSNFMDQSGPGEDGPRTKPTLPRKAATDRLAGVLAVRWQCSQGMALDMMMAFAAWSMDFISSL